MLTYTIKPVFGNSKDRRILHWVVTYHGKVLHSSSSIYSEGDQVIQHHKMQVWCRDNNATHYKDWITDTKYKLN